MTFFSKYNHDSRSDLGYGRVTPRFHISRQRGDSFPYTEPDESEDDIEDVYIDDDTAMSLNLKIATLGSTSMDPFANKKTNPFYFGAGNLKLSDCFFRPDRVLLEVETAAKSMYPIPHMYKGKNVMFNAPIGGVSGHSQTITSGNPLRSGTPYGWSHAPVAPVDEEFNEEEAVLSLEDLIELITRKDR